MTRLRCASALVAAGLAVVTGCSTLSKHSWFGGHKGCADEAACFEGSVPVTEFDGPVVQDLGTVPVLPAPNTVPPQGLAPQNGVPPLQRIVPQPQPGAPGATQSRTTPYTPTSK